MNYFLSSIILVCILLSCTNNKKLDIDDLISKYSKNEADSLKLEAAQFLKKYIDEQVVEKNIFVEKETEKQVYLHFDTIENEKKLAAILENNNLEIEIKQVPDNTVLTNELLETHINAYDFFIKNLTWNKLADRKILLNYLLAYKIGSDEPQDWRTYFFSKNLNALRVLVANNKFDSLSVAKEGPTAYSSAISNLESKWFTYDISISPNFASFSLDIIKCMRKGDCYYGGYLAVYILRSIGIPSTLDYVPAWGSKNSGHAEVVALDANGKISAIPGHQMSHAAKAFRLSYVPVSIWKDSIQPFMANDSFLIPAIKHNHWEDATSTHTDVADVEYELPVKTSKQIAYICAYNYGKWQPVYFGKIINQNKVTFKQMGKDILYYVALPDGEDFQLIGNPFLLDTNGNKTYFSLNEMKRQKLELSKLNTGSRSWVEKNKTYSLYSMNKNGEWDKLGDLQCRKDSVLTVSNIPSGGLYRLVEQPNGGRLERPFGYINNTQIWW